jgi:peptidoglycan/xylan/chitin deacetylase (PgdA/CDA1 family)
VEWAFGEIKVSAAYSRLILDIHGNGAKPVWVDADEDFYWCDEIATFAGILDAIPEATKATGLEIELTFDDGNASDSTIAAPALAKRGLSASFFVCAGRIGQLGYLDGPAMWDMMEAGMKIGSHGWSHIDWRKADDVTLDQEVNGARRKIEDIIGRKVDNVAIPFGSYDRRVMNMLGAFDRIYTSDTGLVPVSGRIFPRWSYQKDWRADTLIRLAAISGGKVFIAQRALKMAIKRLR